MVNVLARVDQFRGLSRFTTWAYKFVMFEVSNKVARHAWQRHPPGADELEPERVPDALAQEPGERAERREQLAALKRAIDEDLTSRQREVFVAVALNDVAIDVLVLQLGSNRNALYKNLFDARRRLRASLVAAGHPLTAEEPFHDGPDDLLRAEDGDAGCDAGVPIMDEYVELELRGEDPSTRFPGTAIHLRACPGCRADHDGLLEVARRFGDLDPA